MNIFKLCAAILQDFGHPKNRCWHTQLNVCEKEGFPCFLYLIQIFGFFNVSYAWYKSLALHKSNRTELTEWQNVRRDLIKRFIFFTTWKFLDCLMSACLVSGVSKSGLMHVKYTADKILSDSPISWSDLVVKVTFSKIAPWRAARWAQLLAK